jgi:CBS domain containing-hemolysin-like protein
VSTGAALGLGVFLLLLNAFFVGAEFAVMSARRSQIEPRAAEGSRAARTALGAMENVSLMLACCQLGITVSSLGLGAVAEPALAHLIEVPFKALGMPEGLVHPVAFALALAVVVYLHVVIGEMVPKNIAIAAPERSALLLATPLVWVAKALGPVIRVLNAIANAALRLGRVEPKDEVSSTYTVEQVQSIVDESRREGLIEDGGLLAGALEFSDLTARDVMVPLADLITVAGTGTSDDVERLVSQTGYSRYPVTAEDGSLLGYLHLKDVLTSGDRALHAMARDLEEVSADAEVEDVLSAMQRSGLHVGRVTDAGHRTLGVVFLEDIIEELVGEIRDGTSRVRAAYRADRLPT